MLNPTNKRLRFDKTFFAEFFLVISKYFYTNKLKSLFLIFLITLCTVGSVYALVALNEFNKDFFNALETAQTQKIFKLTWWLLLIMAVNMVSKAYSDYFAGLLAIQWRRLVTQNYIARWLEGKKYYYMKINAQQIDNPDQRIATDLEQFPTTVLFIFTLILTSVLTVLLFGCVLWKASVPIKFGAISYQIPGFFFFCAIIFSTGGTWLVNLVGRKLATLSYEQQKCNAYFRTDLIKLQEACEEIALYRGESHEQNKITKSFASVVNNSLAINKLKKRLSFFNNGYTSVGLILGFLLAAPFFLAKQIDMGTMVLVSGAFSYTINSFSIFVGIFPGLAEWRATIHRIAEFDKNLDRPAEIKSDIVVQRHHKDMIELSDLQLKCPQGKILLKDINLTLIPATNYLIRGNTGIGKSTLFKAIAGLWLHGSGCVAIPQSAKILFLPQRPYLFEDTLRANLLYPNKESCSNEQLITILNRVGLGKYENNLDEIKNWQRTLSLGQQQLVGFARILLNNPTIIFLDEATSALDEEIEGFLYTYLRNQLPDAIILSIGHRSTLDKFHDQILYAKNSTLIPQTLDIIQVT